jgi:hypothetical protein
VHLEWVEKEPVLRFQLVVKVRREGVATISTVSDDLALVDAVASGDGFGQLREVEKQRPSVRTGRLGDFERVPVAAKKPILSSNDAVESGLDRGAGGRLEVDALVAPSVADERGDLLIAIER